MITDAKLKFWIDNNLNVLFCGYHGVGKTARVKQAFDQAGLKWLYFSAATLDPWVDFIGIPKETHDEQGNKYIELIRPKPFATDEVEAIFLDEFNRSPKKVRNAVMELLQFKSINGKRFNNLRIVWAAINPDDEKLDGTDELEYDVEKLDPAQKDRFEIQVNVPFKPDKGYFITKYGEEISTNAIDWWEELSEKEKRCVSPRRLDYTLDVYIKGGDVRDVLPANVNSSKLLSELKNGSFVKQMESVYNQRNVEEAKKFMAVRNNYDNTIDRIVKNKDLLNFFIPCIKEENLVNLMLKEESVYKFILDNYFSFSEILDSIITTNTKLSKKLKADPNAKSILQNAKDKSISEKLSILTFSKNPKLLTKPVINNQYTVLYSGLGGQSFSNYINNTSAILDKFPKGTDSRVCAYHKILANISDTETHNDYIIALKVLANVLSFSHELAMKEVCFFGFDQLFGYVFNKCLTTSNGKENTSSIFKKLNVKNGRLDKVEKYVSSNVELYV